MSLYASEAVRKWGINMWGPNFGAAFQDDQIWNYNPITRQTQIMKRKEKIMDEVLAKKIFKLKSRGNYHTDNELREINILITEVGLLHQNIQEFERVLSMLARNYYVDELDYLHWLENN